ERTKFANAVRDLPEKHQRLGETVEGEIELTVGPVDSAEVVQCIPLRPQRTCLAADGQRLSETVRSLLELPQIVVDRTEIVEGAGLAVQVTNPAVDGQGLIKMDTGLR